MSGGEWQDIASVPKDGTLVYLRNAEYAPSSPFWWKAGGWHTLVFAVMRKIEGVWDEAASQPTHWRSVQS
jgi:hypothetical protein